jgi:hypothetical protein
MRTFLSTQEEPTREWIHIFKQLLLHTLRMTRHGPRYCCTAAEAVGHLSNRQNTVVADRIAIVSNLCGFEIRLNSNELEKLWFDLSSCDSHPN